MCVTRFAVTSRSLLSTTATEVGLVLVSFLCLAAHPRASAAFSPGPSGLHRGGSTRIRTSRTASVNNFQQPLSRWSLYEIPRSAKWYLGCKITLYRPSVTSSPRTATRSPKICDNARIPGAPLHAQNVVTCYDISALVVLSASFRCKCRDLSRHFGIRCPLSIVLDENVVTCCNFFNDTVRESIDAVPSPTRRTNLCGRTRHDECRRWGINFPLP